jgi:nucleoside-diphosphate-sugar epimerase
VTATTRDVVKAQKLYDVFPSYRETVTFVSVPDFTAPGSFDKVFKEGQFDFVLHTASPIPFASLNLQKDIIDPGPIGTNNLMKAAKLYGGQNLKRIVVTSSGVTLIDPFLAKDQGREKRYDEDDWNTVGEMIYMRTNKKLTKT